jgi:hypothetical protein
VLTVLAAAVGAVTMTAFAATDTNSTDTTTDNTVYSDACQSMNPMQFAGNMMMEQGFGGFGRGPGGQGGHGFMMSGLGNYEVSTEYTDAVDAILDNDSDVANLVSQGYNVTAINPVVKTVIEADGTVATKATAAVVLMQGTSGYATVKVDVTNAAVTQIVTVTRTVIDKSTS